MPGIHVVEMALHGTYKTSLRQGLSDRGVRAPSLRSRGQAKRFSHLDCFGPFFIMIQSSSLQLCGIRSRAASHHGLSYQCRSVRPHSLSSLVPWRNLLILTQSPLSAIVCSVISVTIPESTVLSCTSPSKRDYVSLEGSVLVGCGASTSRSPCPRRAKYLFHIPCRSALQVQTWRLSPLISSAERDVVRPSTTSHVDPVILGCTFLPHQ